MAETFEALRRGPAGFEQRVCIKRILPAFESDQDFVEAFLREATTSAHLRHANIVQVLDFGVADGSHYLALELIDGMDLRKLSGQVGRLSHEIVTLIAIDLASALHHAHVGDGARPSVVHRDISPSNVLVSLAGEVKLVDFGIAKALGGKHLTATGTIKGKIPYLPPEYIERALFEPCGDLFSLGVMLFELQSGRRPFDGESDLDTIRRIASGTRPSLRSVCPNTPEGLLTCIEGLLVLDPAQRIPSAAALLELLPMISVPAARRKLAELVRQPVAVAPDSRADTPTEHAPVAATPPASPHASSKTPPTANPHAAATRTSLRPAVPSQGVHRRNLRPIYALIAAVGLALLTLTSFLTTRQTRTAPPGTPPVPSRVSEASVAAPAQPPAQAPEGESGPTIEPTPQAQARATTPSRARAAELRIVAIPFGDVWIDGRFMGNAPVNARLPAGSHEVAVGDGHQAQRRTVKLTAGEIQSVVFRVETE